MAKKMLIDATHPEETRVVVADGNKVDDFDFESLARRQLAGNIYLAKITRVEPSLQAAFVDYGGNRHGFLAFSEIHPDYYQIPVADREALLAEEEEAARNADRDEPEEAERKPRKPRRSRKQAAPAETSGDGETKEIAGLEVISVEGEEPAGTDPAPADTSAPESLNVVDAEEPGAPETPAEEVAAAAPAAEPEVETTDETPVADSSDGDVPEGDAPANDATPDDDTPPKTMAEDSGLDDESVSEDIQKPAEDAPEKPARKPRRRRKVAEPAESETAEAAAAEEVSTPDAPAQDASAADTPAADTPAADAPVGAAGSDTPAEAASSDQVEADASPAEPEEKTPRKRTRRPRRKKEAAPDDSTDTDGDSQTDGDTDGDSTKKADVESVGAEDLQEEVVRARSQRRRRYKIQDVVKVRQIMLVQVVKEERGNKGAALTTYLSLAGRYCVLMPNTARGGGISRKITQISDRKRLREIIDEQEVPKGMGLIVRTAGAERTRPEIKRDFEFLSRQWEQVRELTLKSIAPCLIYEEGSLIKRSIRDLYSKDIDAILVEGEDGYREAKDYMKMLMPSHAKNVQLYEAPIPLFVRYQAESYLNGMFSPTVQLKSGGYIVIGITEALVAVDVNSGRATKQGSIEETALQTNLEAADEVARQCRLRDLAGLIVIDFIDMDENRNNRAVEKRMKDRLKNDRARIQIGRISSFGLMEMSRQRLRPGMLEATTQLCPTCQGMGIVRSDENMALSILREVEEEAVRGRAKELVVTAPIDITNFLINHKRDHITGIETRSGVAITVLGSSDMTSPNFTVEKAKTPSREAPKRTAVISAGSVMSDVEAEEAELVEETDEQEVREPRSEGRAESRTDGRPESRTESRSDDNGEPREGRSRRRRGKRGGRRRRGGENDVEETGDQSTAEAQTETPTETQTDDAPSDAATADASAAGDGEASGQAEEPPKRKRQRRPRKKAGDEAPQTAEGEAAADEHAPADVSAQAATETVAEVASDPAIAEEPAAATEAEDIPAPTADAPEPEAAPEVVAEAVAEPAPEPEAPAKPKRRGWWSLGG